jgi:hypothetical protein
MHRTEGAGCDRSFGAVAWLTTRAGCENLLLDIGESHSLFGKDDLTVLTLKAAGLVDVDAGEIVRPGILRSAPRLVNL